MSSAADIIQRFLRLGLNSYSKAEMDARYITQGILPISRVGDLTEGSLPCTLSGTAIAVSADIPVLMGGRTFKIIAGTYSFASIVVGNTLTLPLHCYVVLTNGQAVLSFSFTSLAESTGRINIGRLTMSALTPSNLLLSKVSRLDTYRPSAIEGGSALPVSTGTPDTLGNLGW